MYIKRDKVRIKVIPHSRLQSLRSFWPAAGIESSGSNHFEITKEITAFCPSGLTQSSSMAHARDGCSQSTRFLPQARRIVGSGDENGLIQKDHNNSPISKVTCLGTSRTPAPIVVKFREKLLLIAAT